jgi:Cu/Ag efflux protein CusF
VKPFFVVSTLFLSMACAPGAKPAPQKHYALSGKVVSVNAKEQSAAIDAAAVKDYMEAMTMEYPIQSKTEFATLHPGDHITATIDVGDDGSFTLSHIKILPAEKK